MPPDIDALVSGTLPAGNYVSASEAMSVAEREHEFIPASAKVEAFLVQATEPDTARAANPIVDRPVWIIRYSEFAMDGPAPLREDGSPAETKPYELAYVYIDAATGGWLGTKLESGGDATPET